MTPAEHVEKIKRRAKTMGVPMTRLCGMAGVHYASWYRWSTGEQKPREGTLDRLDAMLDELKDARRHG